MRISIASLAFGVVAVSAAYAQYVISAHSGVVQQVEGSAYINDDQVDPKFGHFPEIKDGQVFRTEEGRAEILLTPGSILRLAENSSLRMVSNKLTDTRIELLSGSAMVETQDMGKDNAIMLLYKGTEMTLVKHGLYRIDSEPAHFQVYDGEAIVKNESGQLTLKGGKQTPLAGVLIAENFDRKLAEDDLYRWSARRDSYLSKANISSAMGLRGSGGYSSYAGMRGGGWMWNDMFGMYTYMPYGGSSFSPFGFGYWSPYTVGNAFLYPGYYYGGSGGSYRTTTSAAYTRQSSLGSTTGSRNAAASGSIGLASGGGGLASGGGGLSSGGGHSGGGFSGGGGLGGGASMGGHGGGASSGGGASAGGRSR
jgi:hypothetical protein